MSAPLLLLKYYTVRDGVYVFAPALLFPCLFPQRGSEENEEWTESWLHPPSAPANEAAPACLQLGQY